MSRRTLQSKRTKKIIMIVSALLLVIIFRGYTLAALHVAQRPFVRAGTWITDQLGVTKSQAMLDRSAIKDFEGARESLLQLQAQNTKLETENKHLQDALNFSDRRRLHPVGANIISRNVSNDSSQMVIDQGRHAGIFVGAPVIVGDGIFVGKVVSVAKFQSTISTITDKQNVTAVSMLNNARTIGIAEGLHGNLSIIRFIPVDENIEVDDITVTSGLEEFIPSGLLVGLVNTVRPDSNAPFQEAIIEPIADIRRYSEVIVLLPLEL